MSSQPRDVTAIDRAAGAACARVRGAGECACGRVPVVSRAQSGRGSGRGGHEKGIRMTRSRDGGAERDLNDLGLLEAAPAVCA